MSIQVDISALGDNSISTNLAAVRAAIAAKEQQRTNRTGSGRPARQAHAWYDTPVGGTTVYRILPDGNPDNPLPWQKKYVMKVPFLGVCGSEWDTDQPVVVTYTSLSTFPGMRDPILQAMKPVWKIDEELARRYYHKLYACMQALVVSSPVVEDTPPENPIRHLVVPSSIIEKLEDGVNDPDLEWSPFDYEHGKDFRLIVTTQGSWRAYKKSTFASKERPLSEAERGAIDKFGLIDTRSLLGEPLPQAAIDLLPQLLESSLAGEPFDHGRFGEFFRAWPADRSSGNGGGGSKPAFTAASSTTDAIMNAIQRRTQVTVDGEPIPAK